MPSSFEPIIDPQVSRMVLGSMPGVSSLQQQQYYGHPKNVFWRIAGSYLEFERDTAYPFRLKKLLQAGVGLWDVAKYCEREGSLDGAIVTASVVANDYATLLNHYTNIDTIYFNGRKAEQLFLRFCQKDIEKLAKVPHLVALPSTSPAHAAMPYAEKLRQWKVVFSS